MNGKDYYVEARSLGSHLAAEGYPEWDQRFEEIILGGSTATEILMGIRWLITSLLEGDEEFSAHVRGEAQRLRADLNNALAES